MLGPSLASLFSQKSGRTESSDQGPENLQSASRRLPRISRRTETVPGLSLGPPHLALPARKHFQVSPVFQASPLALGPGEEGGVFLGLDASALWGGQTLTEFRIMPG